MHAQLIEQARALKARTVDLRRRIHRHPELGLDLPRTREAVLEALAGLELDIALSETTSGIVATLHGARPGPTVLLRGDMDALPLVEETGLEFASAVAGRMHACGHDAHTAMPASAAPPLSAYRDQFAGAGCFMFQPGEEGPGGAEPMLAEGLLAAGGPPLAAFALHVAPELPPGGIGCRSGPILAGVETVAARILGRGGQCPGPPQAPHPLPG
ncbi:MAG TPA: M20/M25/M40 family metallo-hydrolase, partial [Anaerolineales bacterium]|nr:M20/M25/M40 family metallo-hydrolase [Anaerolineales bacterium]